MRWHGFLSLAALIVSPVQSVFVDEAFRIDFHQALIGSPQPHTTFFHKPDSSSSAALLYTLSDKAVLGAVNPRDGSLLWRQAIAGEPVENATDLNLVAGEGDGRITTAYGEEVIAWDASSGQQIWSHGIRGQAKAIGLQAVPVLGSSREGDVQDVLLLTQPLKPGGGYFVSRLGGDGSGERWHYSDFGTKLDVKVSVAASPKYLYYITQSAGLVSGQKTNVVVLDIATGKYVKDYSVNVDAEAVSADGQLVAASCSGAPFLVTSEKPYKSIKLSVLGSNKVSTITLEDKSEDVVSVKVHAACGPNAASHFLVHAQTATKQWAEVYHFNTGSSEASRAYALPATQEASAFAASSNAEKVYFTRVMETEVAVYSSESHEQLGRWTRKQLGVGYALSTWPVLATAEVASRDASSVAVRVAVTSPEGSWYMLRNGETQWSRPEVLAYASMSAWSDDVSADPLIQELKAEVLTDPASAYINRVYRHTTELMRLPQYSLQLPQKILNPAKEESPTRKSLIGEKSILLATCQNRLLSVSAISGKIQWHSDLSPVLVGGAKLRSLTTENGRATMYASDGSVIVVDTANGELIENKAGSIPVAKLIELPGTPASTILKISDEGIPEYASDFAPSVPAEGNTVITLSKSGQVQGWTVGTNIAKTWKFGPANTEIVDITSRPSNDPIASIGKVLGDRSVLYKYVSPNLAVLTALTTSASAAQTLTIYLIDAVTGTILHTSSHPGVLATSPISTVLSENWLAYTFTSVDLTTSAISSQLIISELYESSIPNERSSSTTAAKGGNYSTYNPDAIPIPHVKSLAFALSEPITNLTVTSTTQGISARSLIAYLPHSHSIATIPRHVLDARRPVDRDPTSLEAQEEGLFRYQPHLELDPKYFLSHSREVLGVKDVVSAPTLLESTSLVFAFGHDIFGTQVAPSQTFDVLGKSFKKGQLVLTVVALFLGVLGIRPLVRRKVVERGWM